IAKNSFTECSASSWSLRSASYCPGTQARQIEEPSGSFSNISYSGRIVVYLRERQFLSEDWVYFYIPPSFTGQVVTYALYTAYSKLPLKFELCSHVAGPNYSWLLESSTAYGGSIHDYRRAIARAA